MRPLPAWPVAAGSLILGFAVAQATGVRSLGGIVLAAGAVWCTLRWRADAGLARAVLLLFVYAAGFAASHALADTLGAWGSVLAVATLVALASVAVADLRATAGGSGAPQLGARHGAPSGKGR